jgi:dihydrolipoamide dehydrogenase
MHYGVIPSVVYTHLEVAWVGKAKQDLKDGVKSNICQFAFLANSQAKTNSDIEGQVMFLFEETDLIHGMQIIGALSMLSFDS